MSRFFGYSHYYILQDQRRLLDDRVSPPPEGFSLLARTLLVLAILGLAAAAMVGLALAK